MPHRVQPKLVGGFLILLSAGILFAFTENTTLLEQLMNYPNPFDSRKEGTFITYRLSQELPVQVTIYDLFGYEVRRFSFSPGEMGARNGVNTISWDGTDASGSKVSKGGYVCQVMVEGDRPVQGIRKIGVIH